MDREMGARLLAAVESLAPGLGELDLIVSEIADEAERKEFRLKLGEAFRVVTGMMRSAPVTIWPCGDMVTLRSCLRPSSGT